MSREIKMIIFSLLLLISVINKQCNSTSDYTPSTSSSNEPNTDYNSNTPSSTTTSTPDVANNNSSYSPTSRPASGFSPYNSYYGKGIYNNSTDNTIEVTAPLKKDIVIMFKDIYSGRMVRNEYIRANTMFSLTGIPYGKYKFFYLYGDDWSANANFKGGRAKGNFLKDKGVGKSDKTFDCEFEDGYYGTYSLKLQLYTNGNLSTVEGSENDL
jgi:hypothetical protein